MIGQTDALKTLADLRTDELVIGSMSAGLEWSALSPSPLNFPVLMSMSFGSSFGLGLALARPDKRVIVLDGDGSLLMNLGSLVTIADASPANLVLIVFENGLYRQPGDIPLPGSGKFSLSGLAREAGLNNAYEFDNIADYRERIPGILRQRGPTFISLKVVSGSAKPRPDGSFVSALHRGLHDVVQAFRDELKRER